MRQILYRSLALPSLGRPRQTRWSVPWSAASASTARSGGRAVEQVVLERMFG